MEWEEPGFPERRTERYELVSAIIYLTQFLGASILNLVRKGKVNEW